MKKLGFTLMELMIVLSILALLATGLLITLNPKKQIERTWDGQKKADLYSLQTALDDYNNDNNSYPPGSNICYDSVVNNSGICSCHICGKLSPSSLLPYLPKLPCDPQRKDYLYQYNCDTQQQYIFCARLNESAINNNYNYGISTTQSNPNDCNSIPTP